jgi:hypothetical protein
MKFEMDSILTRAIEIILFPRVMITGEITSGLPSTNVKKFDDQAISMDTTICAL